MKRLLSLAALLLMAVASFAHDFEVDGIYYVITSSSSDSPTVSVSYKGSYSSSYSNEYTGSVKISETVTYSGKTYSVTSIGRSAFSNCTGLTSITIPSSVTWIDDYAFSGCSGLTSINIPNSVTSIREGAFYGCSGLTSINIPDGITSIGMFAFWGCSGLTSITIPNSVTSIREGAFYGCTGLTSIIMPNSVTTIGNGAFWGCSGLTSITIPESVTSIGDVAFYQCSGLTNITIPASVRSIGPDAFNYCTGLESIYSYIASPTSDTGSEFDSSNYTNATLYVPKGTKALYQNTDGWKNFQNIVEFDVSAVQEISGEEAEAKVTGYYSIDGKRLSAPQKGQNIIRMSDGTTRKIVR